jgi:hypothetical protein
MRRVAMFILAVLLMAPLLAPEPARAQGGELPDAYFGHWEGTATQTNPTAEWPLTITLTGGRASAVVGRIDYSSLVCSGELRLKFLNDDGTVELAEDITNGEEVCADGGVVTLHANADGSLEYRWTHPIVNSPATGVLSRVGVAPIALKIPSLQLDAAVEAREVVNGRMQDPTTPWMIAWYRDLGWIGAPGNAVLYGYPDWEGIGPVVFYALPDVAQGDRIEVIGTDCLTYAYEVGSVEFYDATDAPLSELFAPNLGADAELLTLFSFTEPYNADTAQYERLVVVRAGRIAEEPTPAEEDSVGTPDPDRCLAAAPTLASPVAGAVDAEVPSPTSEGMVTFNFDTGVTAEDEAYIREGVRLAQDFIAATFGLDVSEPVTVEVQSSDPGRSSAEAGNQRITFRTAHPVWITSNALQRTKIVVHEYFHLLQEDLLSGHEPWPIWLQEGTAEYVAFLTVAERGLISYDEVRNYHYGGAAYNPLLSLEEMESWAGFAAADQACCAYSLSPLAVEILTADRGITAITDYYTRLGRGEDRADAFAAAFGVELADFYATFAVQQQGFAPLGPTHPSVQFAESFVEGAADVTISTFTTPLTRGEQGVLTAVTAPGVPCTMQFTPAPGAGVRSVPVHADAGGTVFWLLNVEPDLPRGMAVVEVSCGAAPASVTIELV